MSAPESVTITLPRLYFDWLDYAKDLDKAGFPTVAREIRRQLPTPKPEEPKGLGAVVAEATGKRWVRVDPDGDDDVDGAWESEYVPHNVAWSQIPAVSVLSQGVTS